MHQDEQYRINIRNYLSERAISASSDAKGGNYGLAKDTEDFIRDYLNHLLGCNFRNINTEKRNARSFDLEDSNNKLVAQVSIIHEASKVRAKINAGLEDCAVKPGGPWHYYYVSFHTHAQEIKLDPEVFSRESESGVIFHPKEDLLTIDKLLELAKSESKEGADSINKLKDLSELVDRYRGAVRKDGPESFFSELTSEVWKKEFRKALGDMIGLLDGFADWSPKRYTPISAEWLKVKGEKKTKAKNLLEAILRHREKDAIFMIWGAPGSGKSVSLRKLALEMLARNPQSNPIPLYVNLGEWHNAGLTESILALQKDNPRPEGEAYRLFYTELVAHIKQYIDGYSTKYSYLMESPHFDYLLKHGGFYFIFDSFDEMDCLLEKTDTNQIHRICDMYSAWLHTFLNDNGNGGILASRPENGPTHLGQTVSLHILEFDDSKIDELIRQYWKEPRKGKLVSNRLFHEYSELLPVLRNPLYLTLFLQYADSYFFDCNATGAKKTSIKVSDLFHQYFEAQLLRVIPIDSALPPEELMRRGEDLAFQMYTSERPSLVFPIHALPPRDSSSYWNETIPLLIQARICRGSENKKTVAFSHRRFHEFFYVSYLIKWGLPFRDYAQSILTWAPNRDALVLYCEVAGDEARPKAEEVALFCWNSLKERSANLQNIRDRPTKEAAYILLFMADAFRNRKETIIPFLQEFREFLCKGFKSNADYVVLCAMSSCISLLDEEGMRDAALFALQTERTFPVSAALRSIRLFSRPDGETGVMLIRYFSGRSLFSKLRQFKGLHFSLSLSRSPGFLALRAYHLLALMRDFLAILCALIVLSLGFLGFCNYNPDTDLFSQKAEQMQEDIDFIFQESASDTSSSLMEQYEANEILRLGVPLETIALGFIFTCSAMFLFLIGFLFHDHIKQAHGFLAYFSLTSRSASFHRYVTSIPFSGFFSSIMLALLCRDLRSIGILFAFALLTAIHLLAMGFIFSCFTLYLTEHRRNRALIKQLLHTLLHNKGKRQAWIKTQKENLKQFFILLQEIWKNLKAWGKKHWIKIFKFLLKAFLICTTIGVVLYTLFKHLKPVFDKLRSDLDAPISENVWKVVSSLIAIPFIALASVLLYFVLRQTVVDHKVIERAKDYTHIDRDLLAKELISLRGDSLRYRYVRVLLDKDSVTLTGEWPADNRCPVFKTKKLNDALALLNIKDDEHLWRSLS